MMQRLSSEEDFLNQCAAAAQILDHVEQNETNAELQWFFEECWADWSLPKFTAIFKSFKTPEYTDYLLSVEATKSEDGGWIIRTVKRTP